MRTLYTIVYTAFLWVRMPLGLLQIGTPGKRRRNLGQRFGKFRAKTKQALTNRRMIWLHATHRQAQDLLTGIISVLEPHAPFLKIVVSTSTTAGMTRLSRLLPSHIERFYAPFDLPRATLRTVNVIHPEVVVLLEPELSPNLMRRFRLRRTPVVLINGAPTKRLRLRYRWWWPLYRPLFADLASTIVQSPAEANRLLKLGCRKETLQVIGHWPSEAVKLRERRPLDVGDLLRRVGTPTHPKILLGDHLHPGEEQLLGEVYQKLKARHPDLFLVLIPDRYQRGKEVGRGLKQLGLRYVYRTAVTAVMTASPSSVDCLLVNTRGESSQFCEHASIVVLGKTFTAQGGENPTEAAAQGKPLVFGPHVADYADLTQALQTSGGGVQVRDAAELEAALDELLTDPAKRRAMGKAARETSKAYRGALEQVVDTILRQVDAGAEDEWA